VRIFSWLFGKRETSAASAIEQPARAEEERKPMAAPTTDEQPDRATNRERQIPADPQAENLRRWRESGQPRAWVEARQGQWDHDAWLALLDDLKGSSFWPLDPNAVGLVLEEARHERLRRN
jgi:hypothetical protein